MRMLSEINESLWSSSIKRSRGDEIRKEDDHKFIKALKYLENVDDQFVSFGDSNVSWAPFNFGSQYTDEPGFYMSYKDIEELNEYLKDSCSPYEIPSAADWSDLMRIFFSVIKVGKYWSLFKISKEKEFWLPQFGYISHDSNDDEISGLIKSDPMFYAFVFSRGIFGYEVIKKMGGQPYNSTFLFNRDGLDRIQVRLIKRHK